MNRYSNNFFKKVIYILLPSWSK